jgi:hypothetical protein
MELLSQIPGRYLAFAKELKETGISQAKLERPGRTFFH